MAETDGGLIVGITKKFDGIAADTRTSWPLPYFKTHTAREKARQDTLITRYIKKYTEIIKDKKQNLSNLFKLFLNQIYGKIWKVSCQGNFI